MDSNKSDGSLNKQGEITITFNNESAWMYPHGSYLRIEGNFKTAANADVANNSTVAFINNELMYLFLGGKTINYFKNAGISLLRLFTII